MFRNTPKNFHFAKTWGREEREKRERMEIEWQGREVEEWGSYLSNSAKYLHRNGYYNCNVMLGKCFIDDALPLS